MDHIIIPNTREKLCGEINDIGTHTLSDSFYNYKKIGVVIQASDYHQKEIQFAVEDIVINKIHQFMVDLSSYDSGTTYHASSYFYFTSATTINVETLKLQSWSSMKWLGIYGYKQY